MPELPEVETVVRGLNDIIPGKIIKQVSVRTPKINADNKRGWSKKLIGQKFITARRRGKNILIELSGGHTLWVHLKMTGHLYYMDKKIEIGKHDHVLIDLEKDKFHLRFNDYRKFGRVRLIPTDKALEQKGLKELGPEPLEISAEDFTKLFKSRKRMIKPAMLDQYFIAGLGNIYCDETLFLSRIHPQKLTSKVSNKKLTELHGHIQKILKKSIRLMGTTVDTYSGVNGQTGRFQNYLIAYGREGEPCNRCGGKIIRQKIGSRSAHYCPKCQKL